MAPKMRAQQKTGVIKGSALEAQARRLMANAQNRDLEYINNILTANVKMASLVAELLRDGSLARVLDGKPLTAELLRQDRTLPVTATKWRHIKGPVAKRLLQALISDADKYQNFAESLAHLSTEAAGEQMANLIKFALNVTPNDNLPSGYKNWRSEGVFSRLCKARAEQLGNRLEAVADPLDYGVYKVSENGTFVCAFANTPTKEYDMGVSASAMEGFTVCDNHSVHGFVKTKRGLVINMLAVMDELTPQHGLALPTGTWTLEGFERAEDDKASTTSSGASRYAPSEVAPELEMPVGDGHVEGARLLAL